MNIGRSNRVERYDADYNLIVRRKFRWDLDVCGGDCEFGLEEEATIWIASQIGGLIRFVPTPTESGAENGVFKPEEYRNARV